MFLVGSKVRVVKRDNTDSGCWVPALDQYVNDGKVYIVVQPEDKDGEVLVDVNGNGDEWHFPAWTLALESEYTETAAVDDLKNQVQIVEQFRYRGTDYETIPELADVLSDEAISKFNRIGSTEHILSGIETLINELKATLEVCKKLQK